MQCTKRRLPGLAFAAGLVTALGASAAATGVQGTVTALEGEAAVGTDRARLNTPIADGEEIATEEGASCAVLIERSSLIQFCGQAAVRVSKDAARNATILDVQRGTTRALVEKRAPGAPLEIHTPVAIAEIRGTIVSVTVDPATGDSTFALEEGEVRISPRDRSRGEAVTLKAGKQVTFRANGQAAVIEPLQLQDIAQRAGCLDDFHQRGASARLARAEREVGATEEIMLADILDDPPSVGGGPEPGPQIPGSSVSYPTPYLGPCGPVRCDTKTKIPPSPPSPPPVLLGTPPSAPGEQNNF